MKTFMILFTVGKDRPGIVHDVSTLLFERGANIEDSRMAVLGGCFSIMTLFSCESESLDAIKSDLNALKKLELETFLYEAQDPAAGPPHVSLPLKFEIIAMDHPGIVQKVVRVLHGHHVNIQALNTRVIRAPHSGAPLFDLLLEAEIPPDRPIARLKTELLALAEDLNLDINFIK
jgi:glycine cleavage system transcriptional repressor